jgi:purine-binding chemotaxis protein CheW
MTVDVLFFEIRGRRCALPATVVREVAAGPHVTPVPHAPAGIRGVAPVHGQALPLLDLGVWLSAGAETRPDASIVRTASEKILVVECARPHETTSIRAALAVDRVMRLGTIDEEHSRPAPPGPSFVTATVLDVEGPALLLDVCAAVEHARQAIRGVVRS